MCTKNPHSLWQKGRNAVFAAGGIASGHRMRYKKRGKISAVLPGSENGRSEKEERRRAP
jgi:hypothetical protein